MIMRDKLLKYGLKLRNIQKVKVKVLMTRILIH